MSNNTNQQPVPLAELPPEALIRLPQVLSILPVGRTSFLSGVKTGIYPAPVKIGPRANAWRLGTILDFNENCEPAQ